MADLFNVHFNVNGEATTASLEFRENALALARRLDEAGFEPAVVDEFASKEDGEWVEIYPDESE